jgi:FkbM family methyltransferase
MVPPAPLFICGVWYDAVVRRLAWAVWERMPEATRSVLRPPLAAFRRSRRKHTPLPGGGPMPALPADAVELDTAIGTLWFDCADEHLTPWIRSQAIWEADVMKLLARLLGPGSVFVDVGANVGYHSLLAAQLGAHVVAVEPVPWTLELLQANVWRHGADVEVVDAAASDAAGTLRVAIDPAHRSGAQIGDQGVEVRAAPLDELVPEGAVDVLKVDVEGAEPQVLRGATAILERSPALAAIVEFRNGPHAGGEAPADVLAFYESLGFELCLLHRNGELEPATQAAVLERARNVPSLNVVLRR